MSGKPEKQPEWGHIKSQPPQGAATQDQGVDNGQWRGPAPPQQTAPHNQWNQPQPPYGNYQPGPNAPYQEQCARSGYQPDMRPYDYPVQYGLPKGKAIASLVLGIISLFVAAFITGTLAIILGGSAIGRCNRGEAAGKGMAVAGVVLGIIGIVGWLVLIAAYHGGADLTAP
jgi:hypothetical protein